MGKRVRVFNVTESPIFDGKKQRNGNPFPEMKVALKLKGII